MKRLRRTRPDPHQRPRTRCSIRSVRLRRRRPTELRVLGGCRADRATICARDPYGLSVEELARDRPGQADLERAPASTRRPPERGDPARPLGPLRCLVVRLRVEDEDADPVRTAPAEPDDASGLHALSRDLELPARLPDSSQAEHVQALPVAPRSHGAREDDRAAVRAPEERAVGGSGRAGNGEQQGEAEESAQAPILETLGISSTLRTISNLLRATPTTSMQVRKPCKRPRPNFRTPVLAMAGIRLFLPRVCDRSGDQLHPARAGSIDFADPS
jgi:hypothetical protein